MTPQQLREREARIMGPEDIKPYTQAPPDERRLHEETKRQLEAWRRERIDADAMVYAAQCSLLAAQIDSLAISCDVATSSSLHSIATEIRRADTSLRAVVRLSKATAPTGEPR